MPFISRAFWIVLPAALLLASCATRPQTTSHYRLQGASAPRTLAAPLPAALSIAVSAPDWLDDDTMFYVLRYQEPDRVRSYTQSFWISRPALQLQELMRLAWLETQGGHTGPRTAALRLDIRLLEFSQQFTALAQSSVELVAAATLRESAGGRAWPERLFRVSRPAAPDAAGAARALSSASDQLIADIFAWVQQLPAPAALASQAPPQ